MTSFLTSGYARGITVRGDLAFVGNLYDGGFQIIDIRDPKAPEVLAHRKYTMYNEAWDVAVSGDYAYIVDYFAGVYLVKITDPASPVSTGSYYTPGSIIMAEAVGDTILCGGGSFRASGDRLQRPICSQDRGLSGSDARCPWIGGRGRLCLYHGQMVVKDFFCR